MTSSATRSAGAARGARRGPHSAAGASGETVSTGAWKAAAVLGSARRPVEQPRADRPGSAATAPPPTSPPPDPSPGDAPRRERRPERRRDRPRAGGADRPRRARPPRRRPGRARAACAGGTQIVQFGGGAGGDLRDDHRGMGTDGGGDQGHGLNGSRTGPGGVPVTEARVWSRGGARRSTEGPAVAPAWVRIAPSRQFDAAHVGGRWGRPGCGAVAARRAGKTRMGT